MKKFKAIIFSWWMSHLVVILYRSLSRTPHPSGLVTGPVDVEILPLLLGLLWEVTEYPWCILPALWEAVPSNCTGCGSTRISSELHLVWGLDTETDECAFVLPAESASPATPLLQKAVTAHSLSAPPAQPKPPESVPTASAPVQAQPLAFGSYTDTKCSDDDVQTIPQCLQLFAPVQTCFCAGRGGLLLPNTSQTTTSGILQTFSACDKLQLLGIQKPQTAALQARGITPTSHFCDVPVTVLLFTALPSEKQLSFFQLSHLLFTQKEPPLLTS